MAADDPMPPAARETPPPSSAEPAAPAAPGVAAIGEGPGAYGAGRVSAYAVGQITGYLRELLETDPVLADCWLAGEVRSLSRSQAGHLYFTLADAEGALQCVFFRRENQGVAVEEGDQVLAHGRVSIWTERGELQLYVDALEPEGVGALQAEFQRLLALLEAEGLFEPGRKRALPDLPRAVGVVTSPAGAVWHDIQSVLARRWPLTTLVLAPCRVQGGGAEETIVAAIERLNAVAAEGEAELDAIIVARGGGSMEDLWPFNSEAVARAIFASHLPVVSAVGHETDYTVADYVADLRAPTPSAAAELIAPDRGEEGARLAGLREGLGRALGERALGARLALDRARDRLLGAGAGRGRGAAAPGRAGAARDGSDASAGGRGAAPSGGVARALGGAGSGGDAGARLRHRGGCGRAGARAHRAAGGGRRGAAAPVRRQRARPSAGGGRGRSGKRGRAMSAKRSKGNAGGGDVEGEPYEAVVARLEATLERLEAGDLSLEEALAAYEEGVALAGRAQELLDKTEQRIQELQELEGG